ncbi:MAG: diguanylate cyclase [Christensenellaceae bacterium]
MIEKNADTIEKRKKIGNMFLIALISLLIIGIVFVSIWDFRTANNQLSIMQNTKQLSEVAKQSAGTFEMKMRSSQSFVESIAAVLAEFDDVASKEAILTMETAAKNSGFSRFAIVLPNGDSVTSDGNGSNVADRDYFQKALSGETAFSQVLSSKTNQNNIVIIAAPILKDGEVVAVLRGTYDTKDLDELVDITSFNGQGYVHVIDGSGAFIAKSKNSNVQSYTDNIFDMLTRSTFKSNDDYDQFKRDIFNHKSGKISYSYGGQKKILSYEPIGINDWYVLSVVPQEVVDTQSDTINALALSLSIKIMYMFVLLIIFAAAFFNKSQKTKNELLNITNSVPGGMAKLAMKEHFVVLAANDGFYNIRGYTREEYKKKTNSGLMYEQDRPRVWKEIKQQIAEYTGKPIVAEYRITKKDGTMAWIHMQAILVSAGSVPILQAVYIDDTQRKLIEQKLLVSEERYRIIAEKTDNIIFEYDIDAKSVYCTNNFYDRFDSSYHKDNKVDIQKITEMICEEDVPSAKEFYKKLSEYKISAQVQLRMKNNKGVYVWYEVFANIIKDEHGIPTRIVGLMQDIQEQKEKEFLLEQKAQKDVLTGLYNKGATQALIEDFLNNDQNKDALHAFMIIDIDNFKSINDNMGHIFGDMVLSELAQKLNALFRNQDIIGRIGGDEFSVFLKNMKDEELAVIKAQEICQSLENSYRVENRKYRISASVGIAIYKKHGTTFEELYKNADTALYNAKETGKNKHAVYTSEMVIGGTSNAVEAEVIQSEITFEDNIGDYVFKILHDSKNIGTAIHAMLSLVGKHYGISRVYIAEIDLITEDYVYTYEWCGKNVRYMTENFKKYPLPGIRGYLSCFDKNGIYCCEEVQNAYPSLKEQKIAQGVASFLQYKIEDNGEIKGILGFDQNNPDKKFRVHEMKALANIAQILGLFLIKSRGDSASGRKAQVMEDVLTMPCVWSYVVDAKTRQFRYINKKLFKYAPNVKIGDYCYDVFDEGMVCEDCPFSKNHEIYTMEKYFSKLGLWANVTFSKITWVDGEDAYLVTAFDITKYKKEQMEK